MVVIGFFILHKRLRVFFGGHTRCVLIYLFYTLVDWDRFLDVGMCNLRWMWLVWEIQRETAQKFTKSASSCRIRHALRCVHETIKPKKLHDRNLSEDDELVMFVRLNVESCLSTSQSRR